MVKHKPALTSGSIFRALVKLSIPLILTNILQVAYNLIDTFWVGRLGSKAIGAVTLSFPVIFIMISLGIGVASAGAILVAKAKGAEKHDEMSHIATQTMFSIVTISAILAMIGYFISPFIIGLMHVEPDVYTDAVAYLKISFLGMVPMFFFMVFQSLMRSIGEVKLPFYIVLTTVLLNLLLDPLFIFGWKDFVVARGVEGAAIATIITQFLAALVGAVILLQGKKGIQIRFKDYKPDKLLIYRLLNLGIPVSVEQISRSVGIFAMMLLVTGFGTLALAGYGIGSRVLSFVIIPAFGLGAATSTLVGQNIGAQKPHRVKATVKQSLLIAFSVMSFLGLLLYVFASEMAALFIPNENETIQESALFIKHLAVSFGFLGILIVLSGAFRGAGKTKISMLLTIFSVWIIRIPVAFLLSKYTQLAEAGVWISYPVTNILTALVGLFILLKHQWLTEGISKNG